ncbi:alpha-L-rhamnosidase N-terminal domain-containing protein [Planctomyces sp. SH-PL62]|uniref:alpha-L-rhamnosidase-related protein n=1 Tax=Planctomyces sp. SH-PL62 TaxID=1636152 RepID=UPI00078C0EE9|nr:alpha-L-rhamnosidase N-terminal domain-containing protein [Planctomyces sp. SH-PL62]AMV40823.1 Bacterial alpha-L-rhamnosidase [Planctomyces sp. SH-PL62]
MRRSRFAFWTACWAAVVVVVGARGEEAPATPGGALTAKWIWLDQEDPNPYNQTILARKDFTLDRPARGRVRITADSFYRLSINGRWVNDGPCRAWAEHYQYDDLDVTPYLRAGENAIAVVARYYGVGDFHKVPKRAGLLVQVDVKGTDERTTSVATDESWEVAPAEAWARNTPKISIQMEPAELYDATLEAAPQFAPAKVVAETADGPWKDLRPRDVALLTRQPVPLKKFLGASVVRADGWNFCFPAARLVHPGLIEANRNTSAGCGLATVIVNDAPCEVRVADENVDVAVDGARAKDGVFQLEPGRHLLLGFVRNFFGHDKEKAVRFLDPRGFRLTNPMGDDQTNPFCFLAFPEFAVAGDDLVWPELEQRPEFARAEQGYNAAKAELLASVKSVDDLEEKLADRIKQMPSGQMFVRDAFWRFVGRRVVAPADDLVSQPYALTHESPSSTTIRPSADGDVELLYDLGEQNVGYYDFELVADAGVSVDIFGVEYIAPDGRIQFPIGNRNGMRYVTKKGVNTFTSLKRRSGRYLFVTLRNQKTPVTIRNLRLIESTYPVEQAGSFACSDPRLDRIWEISTRTLKLCMEDTYTDCPLYEQTHWVGDARNESLLAYQVFGATDLARRCIRITADSLEHYPIAGCQTPSSWDVLIPAWSFLWGISIWDYYWYTGDLEALREFHPAAIKNLQGAEKHINPQGLFTGPYWNFFDWSGLDQNRKTVLHNSLFFIGAIDAALKSAEALGDHSGDAWLNATRARLAEGVNRLWDREKQAYPDSVHDDGKASPSTSQHTSFLAILYDVIDPANRAAAAKNVLAPPDGMVRVGSPFAALYHYGAMEALGREDAIIAEIYKNYLPMLDAGATTVWESFATGTTGGGGFPTRSHCHAWSSAPNLYLPRILLGVRPTSPASATVEINPRPSGLSWARGTVLTARGPITVSWKVDEHGALAVEAAAPEGVVLTIGRNPETDGKPLTFNGRPAP